MAKRGIIRALWGAPANSLTGNYNFEKEFEFQKDNGVIKRWERTKTLISNLAKNRKSYPFDTIYVFGEENKKVLSDLGLESTLIHDEPFKYHPVRRHWWHKLFVMKYALENDYDEIIWLDLDCKNIKPIDDEIWDILNKKDTFQATMVKYLHQVTHHREGIKPNMYVPNGSFVYMRDKTIPSKMFEMNIGTWTDEVIYAHYTDNLMGGFNKDKYLELFEPDVAASKRSTFASLKKKEELYFFHY